MECVLFTKFLVALPISEVAKRVKEMGFDGVDLPVRPGSQITHETARKQLPQAAKVFADHGLSLPCIVTGLVRGSDQNAEDVFAAAEEAGVKMMRTGSWGFRWGDDYWQLMDTARRDLESMEPLAEKYGVKANFQIHSGNCLNLNCAAAAMMLKDRNPDFIGLQLDPGHLEISGESIEMALAIIGSYLHSVNVKSPRYFAYSDPETGQLRWRIIWTPLNEGLVNWRFVFQRLKEVRFNGPLSIHAEYPVERSIELTSQLVQNDLRYVRRMLEGCNAIC